MSSANGQATDTVAEVLARVRKKGVRLWLDNGHLKYRAPQGSITPAELETLRSSRDEIVTLLARATVAATDELILEPRAASNRAPLTFSQLAHWNLYRLGEARVPRGVASVTRLSGRLDVDALHRSLEAIMLRHEALRTRIVVCDGVPIQEIDASAKGYLDEVDLTVMPETLRESEAQREIEQLILRPINVAVGPLFGVRLVKMGANMHLLMLAMEHIISDGFSLGVLLRDLRAAYTQAVKGEVSFPPLAMQFADYALWQQRVHLRRLERHGTYWDQHLGNCSRLRFPENVGSCTQANLGRQDCERGWATVSVRIGRQRKQRLVDYSRRTQTTLVLTVFTAFSALVLRWCSVDEAVIRYISDGRFSQKMERTIGYFATALYLRMQLLQEDSFIDFTRRVVDEYCAALEHKDLSYIASQLPRPDFTRNCGFNWLPTTLPYAQLAAAEHRENEVTWTPVRFPHPMVKVLDIDTEPTVLLSETDDEILADIYFPRSRFSMETMGRFGRNFLLFLDLLAEHQRTRIKDVKLAG